MAMRLYRRKGAGSAKRCKRERAEGRKLQGRSKRQKGGILPIVCDLRRPGPKFNCVTPFQGPHQGQPPMRQGLKFSRVTPFQGPRLGSGWGSPIGPNPNAEVQE